MTAINSALSNISLGKVQSYANLQITPLLAKAAGTADYLTLSEAQALGLAVVTEVSEICGRQVFDVPTRVRSGTTLPTKCAA